MRETSWLLPALGAVLGILLALAVRNLGASARPDSWAVSVDRARDSLMGGLAIVFTGLSIVLALTAVTAQTVASRFSLRLLRINQRGLRGKFVIAVFTMATTFILTVQVGLRSLQANEPAPWGGLIISMLLVLFAGATIIWYIGSTMKSLRLDRTLQRLGSGVRRQLRAIERSRRGEVPVPGSTLRQPDVALPIAAHRGGYLADVDTKQLLRLGVQYDTTLAVDLVIGSFLVRGQQIGWVRPSTENSLPPLDDVAAAMSIAAARDPSHDVAYGIRILVDMAIMALSPAINDPYTAVEVVNELTLILVELSSHDLAPRGRSDADGTLVVVVAVRTFSDYLGLATDQILLYGQTDPGVTAALAQLAKAVEETTKSESAQEAARALAIRVKTASGA